MRSSSANCTPVKRDAPRHGVLNLDKPSALTSHDVVARVRRLLRMKRVGHAGTLDPDATGVLLIGLGQGTKLTPFLQESPKTYRATLRLGYRTDSFDASGQVIEARPVGAIGAVAVEAVLAGFRGAIEQIPPMFSALKQQGQRLYTLARRGLEVERQPRPVSIHRLALLELTPTHLHLEIECSSGTYIRTLADDIGVRLGCGAYLASLRRTAIGPHQVASAISLSAFEAAARDGIWQRYVMPLARAVSALPALQITPAAAAALRHGRAPTRREVVRVTGDFTAGQTVAILDLDGILQAMARAIVAAGALSEGPGEAAAVVLRRVFDDHERG